MSVEQLQLFSPRSRRTDPDTSKRAAKRSGEFRARHISKIFCCLQDNGPGTKDEIASRTGLDAVAVARRGKEMERAGLVVIGPEVRSGCRVWRAR